MTTLLRFSPLVFLLAFQPLLSASDMSAMNPKPVPPPIPKIDSLLIEPPSLILEDGWDERRVIVTGITKTGQRIDLSANATFKTNSKNVAIVDGAYIQGKAPGKGSVSVNAGGKNAKFDVIVKSAEFTPVHFVRDVQPAMVKMGCNAGTCHGAAKGKNGFKLSLRGYDPEFDFQALINELSGRRVDRIQPEQSLMLLKPTGAVPHEGKQVMKTGSRYYKLMLNWIAEGNKLEPTEPNRPQKLTLLPERTEFDVAGRTQQLLVLAQYPDGTTRDVTREAVFSTSNQDVATVNEGLISALRRGEAAILVRYEGQYAAKAVSIMGDRNGYQSSADVAYNFIDEHVQAKLKKVKVQQAELCTDAEFLRRVYLDLTGQPPTSEQSRTFLADKAPSVDKRVKLVDSLIGSEAYVEVWSNKWADLLQCNQKSLGDKGVWVFRDYIRKSIAENKPYDQFARELLTARGSSYHNPATNFFRVLREPGKITEDVSQTFLGVRFNCNKCHDHPFERWTQNQYYEFGAYFARVAFKKGPLPGEEIVYRSYKGGEVRHPRTDMVSLARVPFGEARDAVKDSDLREPFVEWLASKENPLFARSAANRIWSYFFGIGIIEPVDDIRASNPPTNPALLDALTDEFIKSNFDVQKLMRTICLSRTYQSSVATNKWNEDDKINFSHCVPRRLSAEQLLDAVALATGVRPKYSGMPAGARAVEIPDGLVAGNDFLKLFGRPDRESSCECARSSNLSLSHALMLINGGILGDAVVAPDSRVAKLIATEKDDRKVIEEIYLAFLNRVPTETELSEIKFDPKQRLESAQDLAWALLNSPAFIFNR